MTEECTVPSFLVVVGFEARHEHSTQQVWPAERTRRCALRADGREYGPASRRKHQQGAAVYERPQLSDYSGQGDRA